MPSKLPTVTTLADASCRAALSWITRIFWSGPVALAKGANYTSAGGATG
jgi:hypothetical protein